LVFAGRIRGRIPGGDECSDALKHSLSPAHTQAALTEDRHLHPFRPAEDTPLGSRRVPERLGHWDRHTDPGSQESGA